MKSPQRGSARGLPLAWKNRRRNRRLCTGATPEACGRRALALQHSVASAAVVATDVVPLATGAKRVDGAPRRAGEPPCTTCSDARSRLHHLHRLSDLQACLGGPVAEEYVAVVEGDDLAVEHGLVDAGDLAREAVRWRAQWLRLCGVARWLGRSSSGPDRLLLERRWCLGFRHLRWADDPFTHDRGFFYPRGRLLGRDSPNGLLHALRLNGLLTWWGLLYRFSLRGVDAGTSDVGSFDGHAVHHLLALCATSLGDLLASRLRPRSRARRRGDQNCENSDPQRGTAVESGYDAVHRS